MLRGDRVKVLRESKGYTHQELADLLNVGYAQIYRFEAGKADPPGDVLSRMSRLFGVTVDFLLGLSDMPISDASDLSEHEKRAIAAWRRGERFEAIKVIVDDN